MQARFPFTYNEDTGTFLVKSRGQIHEFREMDEGLYFLDCSEAVLFVDTVEDDKEKYTKRAYVRAMMARKLQKKTRISLYKNLFESGER